MSLEDEMMEIQALLDSGYYAEPPWLTAGESDLAGGDPYGWDIPADVANDGGGAPAGPPPDGGDYSSGDPGAGGVPADVSGDSSGATSLPDWVTALLNSSGDPGAGGIPADVAGDGSSAPAGAPPDDTGGGHEVPSWVADLLNSTVSVPSEVSPPGPQPTNLGESIPEASWTNLDLSTGSVSAGPPGYFPGSFDPPTVSSAYLGPDFGFSPYYGTPAIPESPGQGDTFGLVTEISEMSENIVRAPFEIGDAILRDWINSRPQAEPVLSATDYNMIRGQLEQLGLMPSDNLLTAAPSGISSPRGRGVRELSVNEILRLTNGRMDVDPRELGP